MHGDWYYNTLSPLHCIVECEWMPGCELSFPKQVYLWGRVKSMPGRKRSNKVWNVRIAQLINIHDIHVQSLQLIPSIHHWSQCLVCGVLVKHWSLDRKAGRSSPRIANKFSFAIYNKLNLDLQPQLKNTKFDTCGLDTSRFHGVKCKPIWEKKICCLDGVGRRKHKQ